MSFELSSNETLIEISSPLSEPHPSAKPLMAADVRSTDGKYHRLIFDPNRPLIQFTLTGSNAKQPPTMLKDLNELLSVRGTPIRMRRGLPVDLNKDAKQVDTPNSLFLYFAEKKNKCRWRIREVVARFTTSSEKKHWLDELSNALKELKQRPKTLLIFVNPYGGKGKAKKVYAEQVELILKMANIDCEVVMTQRANHAFDELKNLVDSRWKTVDGVVSVGGDGLFNECLSAIVCRSQEEADKDITDINVDCLKTPRMRFGIIGAGSANSIVSSVHGTDDCPTAAIHIAMGSQCSVDVCTVHRGHDLMRISANAISYGWLGDVLADSERYRWMGPLRYQYSALRTTIRNPSYFGRVSFCLINEDDQKQLDAFPKCAEGCTLCESGTRRDGSYMHHVQTDFSHVIGCVIPCVSPFTPYGLAPYAGVGDGSMDLALVSRVTRCANMTFMSKVAMHGGKSVVARNSTLNVFRVTRWAFTPAALVHSQKGNNGTDQENQGVWNLDGEILPQPPDAAFHFRLHPRLIKYFGRELEMNQLKTKRTKCCGSGKKQYSNIIIVDQK
ncbi:unnamed protein product [Anisakis simplex]|uniref:Ceramide kinase 1 (inferred by orthology to a C. elegans protein) n=1 Tax=Anisakis simplex TaxID=6269 RepID=A0A0M3JVG6_ANISI|nr:unnamed protein product [Anisakis simplex]